MSNATLPAQISATGLLHPGLPILCLPLKALPRSLLLLPTWNSPKRLELPPLTGPVLDQLPCSKCFSAALTAAHAVLTHRAAGKGCRHPKARRTPDKARPTHQGQLLTAALTRVQGLYRLLNKPGARGTAPGTGYTPPVTPRLQPGESSSARVVRQPCRNPGVETRPA